MQLLDSLLGNTSRREALAQRIDGRPPTDPALADWISGGRKSAAGATVTETTALSLSAVFAGVNLLSRLYGSYPIDIYRRDGRVKRSATDLPVYKVLTVAPNGEMVSSVFRRALEWNRLLTGKACAEIIWDGMGNAVGLLPLEGWRVHPKRDENGALYYLVDGTRQMSPRDMIYVPLISADGIVGKGFLDYAIESLGLNLSAQEFAARFFGNGARPGGLLVHSGSPAKPARDELKKSWTAEHGGPPNAHRVGMVWGGWSFDRTAGSVAPEEAQLLETRRFGIEEVSRWLNIPPHFLADLTRATFSNIEEQGINFVVYSQGLTVVDYEQEYNVKLLSPPEVYCKHNLSALLRGKATERAAFNTQMFSVGKTVNEIRENEDMDPVDGGDEPFVPLNFVPLKRALQNPEPTPSRLSGWHVPREVRRELLVGTLSRLLRQECNATRRAAAKPFQFMSWMDEFLPKHEAKLREALAPVLPVCVSPLEVLGAPKHDADVASRLISRSRSELLDLSGRFGSSQFESAVNELLDHWEESRPSEEADAIMRGEL